MDETVETKGALEMKTKNLLGEGSRGHFKKEKHEGWKGQLNSGQAGGRCIHKLEHTPEGENGVINQPEHLHHRGGGSVHTGPSRI